MKKYIIILMAAALLVGCNNDDGNTAPDTEVVTQVEENAFITVNGSTLQKETFDKYYAMQSYDFEKEYGKDIWSVEQDGKTMREIRQTQTIDYLLRVTLIEDYIEENNIDVDSAIIDEAYVKYMDSIKSDDEILMYYEENGLDEVFLKRFLKDQYILRIYQEELLTQISNDPEVQTLLFEDKFIRYKTRHILVKDETQIDEILALLNDEENPSDFSDVARLYSIDSTSAVKGGDLGYKLIGSMPEAYEQVALTVEPYTVSEMVETEFGYHIIFVDDRQMLIDMIDSGMLEEEIETYKSEIIKNFAAGEIVRMFEAMKASATITIDDAQLIVE